MGDRAPWRSNLAQTRDGIGMEEWTGHSSQSRECGASHQAWGLPFHPTAYVSSIPPCLEYSQNNQPASYMTLMLRYVKVECLLTVLSFLSHVHLGSSSCHHWLGAGSAARAGVRDFGAGNASRLGNERNTKGVSVFSFWKSLINLHKIQIDWTQAHMYTLTIVVPFAPVCTHHTERYRTSFGTFWDQVTDFVLVSWQTKTMAFGWTLRASACQMSSGRWLQQRGRPFCLIAHVLGVATWLRSSPGMSFRMLLKIPAISSYGLKSEPCPSAPWRWHWNARASMRPAMQHWKGQTPCGLSV